jgi:hypothetical protein
MTETLTHPIVKAAIDALQAGDSEAWKELFDRKRLGNAPVP